MQSAPPGWRFRPTDFELLDHYLKNKRLGHLTHCFDIREFELCDFVPSDLLPESSNEEFYFFCPPENYVEKNGRHKTHRKARSGIWRGTGKTNSVTSEDSDEEIGTRKIFVYYDPKPTKWVMHEYAFTAKLDVPFKGDFVLCKLHINKKQKANKKSEEIEPNSKKRKRNKKSEDMVLGCKKGKSSKKARIDLSNCNKASASTFEKQNLEIMANSACGEDEPPNHMTSDYESQSPNKMASTYDIGESCYRSCPTFEYEDLYDMSAFSTSNRGEESFSIVQNPCGMSAIATYNKGEECLSMTQTPYGVNNVSTCNKVETSCPIASDLEYQNPNEMTVFSSNEKCTPGCQWASGVENQSTYEITTVSTYDKDETSSLMDFHFENQNWFKMTSNSSYDKGKPTNLLDFGSQNPSMNCNISVSEEGEWSHLNRVPSYFENQNQYKNTDNSIPGNYWSQNPSMNSDISVSEEGERIHLNRVPSYFENQNQYENTDKSIPGNYWSQYPSMNSNISVSEEGECCHLNGVPSYLNGVPSYFENQNQYENTDNSIPGNYWSTMMASHIQDTTFQEVQSQHKDTDVLISEGHLSPLVDIDVGEYSFSEKDSQLLKEIFARDEQEDTGCSVLQQPIHNKENHSHSGFGTSVSTST
ncbi:hypothetical protein P3X46_003391 [Hevea brasiliensis]|uniref:NAC domain-containing protein n=2 Tax=Hevea brasiliensis TaxID=3981 RepID=A0ABQ9N8P1_HEVBR|nr:uncharacterized protein LOC110661683 isoform X2 [Hevea brasiliensis]KAJ9187986.1 hypothetical protein P3X46_003391 [Hevea brasiliensis]